MFDDVLAEVLEQHGVPIFGRLPALLKQLLGSKSIRRCSEAIESSVKRHLKYWGEVGVHLHQSLALLLLLTVVVGYVASRQLPGKSPEIRVTHATMEYLVRASLWEFDEKRECSRELIMLGSTPIEILVAGTNSTISDVRKDNRFEYMSHVKRLWWKVETPCSS